MLSFDSNNVKNELPLNEPLAKTKVQGPESPRFSTSLGPLEVEKDATDRGTFQLDDDAASSR